MATPKIHAVGVVIDKITNSIEHLETGEVLATSMVRLMLEDLAQIKKTKWLFDWKKEISEDERCVYKLVVDSGPKVMQGLISIEDRRDHIFMHLIESAKSNRGRDKVYAGVPANMIAFACKNAFEHGYEGVVSFLSKTQLVEHYQETLGAKRFAGNNMYIDTDAAQILVRKYYKEFKR